MSSNSGRIPLCRDPGAVVRWVGLRRELEALPSQNAGLLKLLQIPGRGAAAGRARFRRWKRGEVVEGNIRVPDHASISRLIRTHGRRIVVIAPA